MRALPRMALALTLALVACKRRPPTTTDLSRGPVPVCTGLRRAPAGGYTVNEFQVTERATLQVRMTNLSPALLDVAVVPVAQASPQALSAWARGERELDHVTCAWSGAARLDTVCRLTPGNWRLVVRARSGATGDARYRLTASVARP